MDEQNGVYGIGNSDVKMWDMVNKTELWNKDSNGKEKLGNKMNTNETNKKGKNSTKLQRRKETM